MFHFDIKHPVQIFKIALLCCDSKMVTLHDAKKNEIFNDVFLSCENAQLASQSVTVEKCLNVIVVSF